MLLVMACEGFLMKAWRFIFFILSAFITFPHVVWAEGRCPPGQYPVGGPGVLGCAPIPGYGAQQGRRAPVPAGEWLKTWGAIAGSLTTDLIGVSTGERSKIEAEKVALDQCRSEGDLNCKVTLVYHNQCVAIAIPSSGKGVSYIASAPSKPEAESDSIALCSDTGGGQCVKFYSACSEPIFIRY